MSILSLISDRDRLDFSQNFSIVRPAYLGDRLFPDQKMENLMAEYLRLSNGAKIPTMATVHALDTEAEIASRPVFDKVSIEKLFIKRKINQTERIRLLADHGVYKDDAIVKYVFDDMRLMAEAVKTRTEVAKMQVLSTGGMNIVENNLNLMVDYGTPEENTAYKFDLDAEADIIGQIQTVIDDAADNGYQIVEMITSQKILRKLATNKAIQTLAFCTIGQGTYVSIEQLKSLFAQMFGILAITPYDLRYKVQNADGSEETRRFFPDDTLTFISTPQVGIGLYGVTPEEEEYGQYGNKNETQYITISQWATQDPVAVWTKASALFIPVLPDPYGLYIAREKHTVVGG